METEFRESISTPAAMKDHNYSLWATIAHDVQIQCCIKATQSSADYILAHAPFALSLIHI